MTAIRLKTALPGPESIKLMEARRAAIARGPFHSTPIFAKSAKGSVIEDVDGNHLLDFGCGIGVTNVGHAPEAVVAAVRAQAAEILHAQFNTTPHANAILLAEALNRVVPTQTSSGASGRKTFFCNSGAEAVENAIKIARAHTHRQAIVCFEHAFHGRTYMAMTLTAKVKPYKYGFGPFNGEVYRAPFPYAYRWPSAAAGNPDAVAAECFARFEESITAQVGADQVAAVILEPVLGEGGFVAAPPAFLQKLREFCTANGIVLIADEIQSGFGRTGTLFACEQLGFQPDLVTMAKGLGGGMPIAAVTGRADIMDAPIEGGIGGTYGANPVACAAALAVLGMFEDGKLLANARARGEQMTAAARSWAERFSFVGDVRGLGPMLGIELVKDRHAKGSAAKEPNKDAAGAITRFCYTHGVVVLSAGTFGNVLRLLIPLTISEAELKEGLGVLESAFASVKA